MPGPHARALPLLALLSALLCSFAIAAPARAQQPLGDFLAAADEAALDVREAEAILSQTRSQVDEARARLLPSFTAIGTYQRNEFEARIAAADIVIQPYDQLTAQLTLTVPLIDVGAWSGFFQAEALGDAADAQLEAARLTTHGSVVQLYYQLVASRALVGAADRNLALAERNREAAAARVEVGVSPQLELSRAEAEVARARQARAEAALQATLAERSLLTLTGLVPDGRAAVLEDDLEAEEPLARFLDASRDLPAVRAAQHSARAADIASDTAWTALLPVISGSARESGSNVGGFTGQNWSWALLLQASWTLDFARPAQISTRAAAADVATVRAERVLQQVENGIFESWQRIEASRAQAEAANAALDASRRASEDAHARFDAGAATQLDVIQAERDLFQAEVARIQAIASLAVARATLRIRAGMEL